MKKTSKYSKRRWEFERPHVMSNGFTLLELNASWDKTSHGNFRFVVCNVVLAEINTYIGLTDEGHAIANAEYAKAEAEQSGCYCVVCLTQVPLETFEARNGCCFEHTPDMETTY